MTTVMLAIDSATGGEATSRKQVLLMHPDTCRPVALGFRRYCSVARLVFMYTAARRRLFTILSSNRFFLD